MKITILTLFPELFQPYISTSIIGRAVANQLVSIEIVNIRDYTANKHFKVDDYPYGGGAGMVMSVEPVAKAINASRNEGSLVLMTSAHGKVFNQSLAKEWVGIKHLILVCGHYEGIDARIDNYIDGTVSLGDFIMTGGELAGMVIADAIIRLLPGVISQESLTTESFEDNLLEAPVYTRPEVYEGFSVPEVLLSGHHEKIRLWRLKQALKLTLQLRPDLIEHKQLTKEELSIIDDLKHNQ
jgi:tRNA (guanine37-N1)-methyltransferase